jgi:hypothetical protein
MIETPLVGRYQGEGRRLIFGPPAAYHQLVYGVGAVGTLFVFLSSFDWVAGLPSFWWFLIGSLLVAAAIVAALSLQLIVFDLKEGTYRRRQGPGLLPRQTHGRIADLDAVVVIAETMASMPGTVTYHIVLHWKMNAQEPLLVLHQDTRQLSSGQPLNFASGPILQLGSKYANSLGVKFFDNSHFSSPCPVPLW